MSVDESSGSDVPPPDGGDAGGDAPPARGTAARGAAGSVGRPAARGCHTRDAAAGRAAGGGSPTAPRPPTPGLRTSRRRPVRINRSRCRFRRPRPEPPVGHPLPRDLGPRAAPDPRRHRALLPVPRRLDPGARVVDPVLVQGRQAPFITQIVGGTMRLWARSALYALLATGSYPWFGIGNDHPITITYDEYEPQNRLWGIPVLGITVRVILLIPHLFVLWVLGVIAGFLVLVAGSRCSRRSSGRRDRRLSRRRLPLERAGRRLRDAPDGPVPAVPPVQLTGRRQALRRDGARPRSGSGARHDGGRPRRGVDVGDSSGASVPSPSATTIASSPGWSTKSVGGLTNARPPRFTDSSVARWSLRSRVATCRS